MSNPIAELRGYLEKAATFTEPLTPTVDENGVVVLVNDQGHPRVWMSGDAYETLQARLRRNLLNA